MEEMSEYIDKEFEKRRQHKVREVETESNTEEDGTETT
jgi:hypothetical protein